MLCLIVLRLLYLSIRDIAHLCKRDAEEPAPAAEETAQVPHIPEPEELAGLVRDAREERVSRFIRELRLAEAARHGDGYTVVSARSLSTFLDFRGHSIQDKLALIERRGYKCVPVRNGAEYAIGVEVVNPAWPEFSSV